MTAKGSINIVEAVEDPKLFGKFLGEQASWTNWKVALKAIFALPMDDKERRVYRKYTSRKKMPENRFKEFFAIVGRRGGKSSIMAVVVCYLALFFDWTQHLSLGETGWIMVIAADRNQARVMLNYIRAILQLPMFKKQMKKDLTWEIELKNQITISVKTCDYRTVRGFTVVAAVCDELAFWKGEYSAQPDKEIINALRPAMATVPGSMLIGISTAYARKGVLYETYKRHYGKDSKNILVWKATTREMNPTVPEKFIKDAMAEDLASAKAEYLSEFREDIETFLPIRVIEAAIVKGRHILLKISAEERSKLKLSPFSNAYKYYAFVDPAGGSGSDSMTLAISHKDENGKVIIDRLEERRPPFHPQNVVEEFAKIMGEYGIRKVSGDRYTGSWCETAFKDAGARYNVAEKTRSELYLNFEPLMMQGQVELLDNKRLYNQLCNLERRTHSGGRDSVDHSPGAHDDLPNCVAGACYLVKNPPVVPRIWRAGANGVYR